MNQLIQIVFLLLTLGGIAHDLCDMAIIYGDSEICMDLEKDLEKEGEEKEKEIEIEKERIKNTYLAVGSEYVSLLSPNFEVKVLLDQSCVAIFSPPPEV